jgi:hypothetical protein
MPRPRPPHLQRFVTRHGKLRWCVRVGRGAQRRRVFIRGTYGSPEFEAAYHTAIAAHADELRVKTSARTGSLAWLIDRYRDGQAWLQLSPATRRQRDNIFKQVIAMAGAAEPRRRDDCRRLPNSPENCYYPP